MKLALPNSNRFILYLIFNFDRKATLTNVEFRFHPHIYNSLSHSGRRHCKGSTHTQRIQAVIIVMFRLIDVPSWRQCKATRNIRIWYCYLWLTRNRKTLKLEISFETHIYSFPQAVKLSEVNYELDTTGRPRLWLVNETLT